MTRRKSTAVLLAILAALAIGLVWGLASSLGASGSPAPASGKIVLKIGLTAMPDNLNPLVGYNESSYEVWNLNYDLMFPTAPDGSWRPGVIESMSHSADGLTWTLKIRPGVTWQDGQPLTAKDVAWTLNYLVKNQIATYATETKLITGAEATDATTCLVHTSAPKADFGRGFIYILPEHIWAKYPNPQKVVMTYPIVGSGPFQCVQNKQGNYVVLKKNPDYWGPKPTLDEVWLQGYTNDDTMLQDFKLHTIDFAYGVPPAQYPSVSKMAGVKGYESNYYYAEYICMNSYQSPDNLGNPVLEDVKFRQALMYAVDKQELVNIGLGGYGKPAESWLQKGQYGSWDPVWTPAPDQTYTFDIAKANQLLDAAGYPVKNGVRVDKTGKPITLRLWARSQSTSSQKELKLVAGWWQALHLKINFQVMDEGVLDSHLYNYTGSKGNVYAPDFDVYQWDSYGYADPGNSLAGFTTDQIQNWNDACWSNKQYDALITKQASELDPTQRADTLKQCQQMLYENAVDPPITYPYALSVANDSRWTGWVPYMNGTPILNGFNIDTYVQLRPKSASSGGGGSSTTTWIVVGAAIAVVAIVVIAVLNRRGKKRVVEE